MGLLEDLNSGKYNLVLFAIIFILFFHQYWGACSKTKEPMTNVSNDIKEAVKQVYLADVEAIRNLSEIATKINAGTFVFPGNLNVTGSFNYLPRGTIVAYNQTTAPAGWALCDGSQGTPDLRGKFIFGNGGSRGMNTTGGAETVALSINHMPSHNHNVNGSTSITGKHVHNYPAGDGGHGSGMIMSTDRNHRSQWTYPEGEHSHTFNVNSGYAGANQAHENMPPFYVLTYIMKL
jgi:microcystin-dependent protein